MKKLTKMFGIAVFAAVIFSATACEMSDEPRPSIPAELHGTWNEVVDGGIGNQLTITEFSVISIVRRPVEGGGGTEYIVDSSHTFFIESVIRGALAQNPGLYPEVYGYTLAFGYNRGMTGVHIDGGYLVINGAGGGIHGFPFTVRMGRYELAP
ncbi:MAG: hypothetical protein FWG66_15975 [Spirochaetes bacterium]|nr:hypothetical protein [Spirochaetota bacterium]